MSRGRTRTRAEWVTFAVSCLILVALAATIGWLWVTDDERARMVARVSHVEHIDAEHVEIIVDIANTGDHSAVNVQVIAEIQSESGPEEFGTQTVDFLTGGETETLVFIAPTADPDAVTIRIGSYSQP